MHGTAKLGQMDGFAGDQFIYRKLSRLRRTEDGMIVRINGLGNTEVHAALVHGFQITIEAFILRKEKADDLPGSIIDGAVEGVFNTAAEPFIRSGIDLDELSGMRFAFPAVGTVTNFFLFRAFKTCIF